MNVEFINPFLDASTNMLKEVCNIDVKKKKLYIKRGIMSKSEVTIDIGITGDIKGYFILNMESSMAMDIASRMMGGMEIKSLDEITISAVSELCNMIAGHASMGLSKLEKNIDITPPVASVNAPGSKMNYINQTICVPLETDKGSTLEADVYILE